MQSRELLIRGFGLVGGSVAAAAKRAGWARRVVAVEAPLGVDAARASGLADEVLSVADEGAVAEATARADLVVLAAPIHVIEQCLPGVLAKARVVTDCGSTKRTVLRAAATSPRARRFVAGHPMAGAPGGGVAAASPALFAGRPWFLCVHPPGARGASAAPGASAFPALADDQALELVEDLARAVGARPLRVDAEWHDAAVARTSHLVRLLATALRRVAGSDYSPAAGPAFERATAGDRKGLTMWSDVLAANRDETAAALGELIALLRDAQDKLAGARLDPSELDELLAAPFGCGEGA